MQTQTGESETKIDSKNTAAMTTEKLSRLLLAAMLSLMPGALIAAEDAVEEITELLSQRFYEVEFFVFERSAVMDFNTREVLLHKTPQAYPPQLLAMPYPGEIVGEHYTIDPMTLLCMSYPTLDYTTTPLTQEDEPAQSDLLSETADEQSIDTITDAATDGGVPELIAAPEQDPVVVADPRELLRAAVADFENELIAGSNQWLPEDSFRLRRESRQVERRAGGRLLFHGRWLQVVPPRDAPLPIILPDTDVTGPGKELSGSVDVTLGRYLHFQARLNYVAPALGARPYQVALSPQGTSTPTRARQIEEPGFMTLAQSRRMRSQELHYLDHPKLGIVVRVDPVTIPEELLLLHAELTEDLE
jgi:hypothetical protein